ncbi:DUF4382 domain-containing protein [Vibrio sp. SCSIO 43140]|uniref:DUF4382 domain-containing protein n=1 Tax=Vibrio sp. SCSIO 43140 TaxID=2819100 RepID=UPI002075F8ED|nr:DUF4382 domain-containing protein [Vibrio sp. SCSIO 43140]USD61784.1 DUF4382 domain-containing protein [Vibrio sp. SCSIO 43140]
MKTRLTALAVLTSTLLVGCGSEETTATPPTATTGKLNLGVSDAPVDDAMEVVLGFKDVVLVPIDPQSGAKTGDPIALDVSGEDEELRQIDLMEYQGSNAETIIRDYEIPTGHYALCLYAKDGLTADDTTSYVRKTDGNLKGLVVPNKGSCLGYKPDDKDQGTLVFAKPSESIEIMAGFNSYIVEFDLRKALTDPTGKEHMLMNRNGVALVNASESGHIRGKVDTMQYQACEADSASYNAIGGAEPVHAVYLYAGEMDRTTMGDVGSDSERVAPVSVANVNESVDQDNNTVYEYEFGYVGPGSYSIGYTCTAYIDQPETEETAEDGFLIYQHYVPVEVKEGEFTEQDITPIL